MQTLSLGSGCVYAGIVMHELMHAAGFWHEQSRYDRDSYVIINWQNIMYGLAYNFDKVKFGSREGGGRLLVKLVDVVRLTFCDLSSFSLSFQF